MTVLRYRRWVLSTGDLAGEGAQEEITCAQSRSSEMLDHGGLIPILVKPVILRWLVHDDDGSLTPSTTDRVRSATHPSS
jgi:hypothetical protein